MFTVVENLTAWTPGSEDSGNSLCLEGYGG
jgi:hypothetical protein